jgi:hypothetical protein
MTDELTESSDTDSLTAARSAATAFDTLMKRWADERSAQPWAPTHSVPIKATDPVSRWNVVDFVESYVQGSCYPIERIAPVVDRVIDVKLQFILIMIDLGLQNENVYAKARQGITLDSPVRLRLIKASLDQAIIGKNRVLWERVINLVYYLEEGGEVSGNRSKKTAFAKWANDHSKWQWLQPFHSKLTKYDDTFRTPEYHKGSVLRAELLGRKSINPNDLVSPSNALVGVFWENLISIVKGGRAVRFP